MDQIREMIGCQFCKNPSKEGQAFAMSGSKKHYAPDLHFKVESLKLELNVHPEKKILKGIATQKFLVLAQNLTLIRLDQVGLDFEEVNINGEKASYRTEAGAVWITLNQPVSKGERMECVIRYQVTDPRKGLYFTSPTSDRPEKPYQVWTQGQDENNRHWFPTLDYPNQKVHFEVLATVPKGYTAISNGALISQTDQGEETIFHYKMGMPQVTYLITLVVGKFSILKEVGPRQLPVWYYVEAGREDDAKRAFGETSRMIEAFEKKIGVPYPYEKYIQVAVQDFIFGGMENTSATTQTDLTLHDARAHLDYSSNPLVSHELAHQWFGDLVTCKDWSQAWLNEGFATFFERVWIEEKDGHDEAKYYAYGHLQDYLEEDRGDYRRSVVCNTYIDPVNLFDAHLYQKGGLILHLIRSLLGEESFWEIIQTYLRKHAGQNVETLDLIRAIEDVTGRNMRQFFDEWIFSAGHPDFEVSYQWHAEKKLVEWSVEQKQTGGESFVVKNGFTTPLFHLPVRLELTLQDGSKHVEIVQIHQPKERFFFPVASCPVMVRFDPESTIPKTLKFPRASELLVYQMKNDSDCMGRIEAVQELKKISDVKLTREIGEAALKDSFWGVQVEAAKVLGSLRSETALEYLLKLAQASHPKVRRAAASALGKFQKPTLAVALKNLATKDPSYFVSAEATFAYALSHARLSTEDCASAEKFLIHQATQSSFREVIRSAAYRGLSLLPRRLEPTTIQAFKDGLKKSHTTDARVAAARGLGKVLLFAKGDIRKTCLDLFTELAYEEDFLIHMSLVGILEEAGELDVIPILSVLEERDPDGRIKREARRAKERINQNQGLPEAFRTLQENFEKLQEDHQKLRSKVEELKH